jgi:ABC-type uncharacterized transport system substrate-binding protein
VTAKAELGYGADGRIEEIRHAWTFDEAYSAYVTQGLDKNRDGRLDPDELHELAKLNAESLSEYGYFSILKADGAKQEFATPRDPSMTYENGQATLRFVLPLKAPAAARKALALEVYDPTFFVAFAIAEGNDAVTLARAPQGCQTTVTRAKGLEAAASGQNLSEQFFAQLDAASNFGASFANRVLVLCP